MEYIYLPTFLLTKKVKRSVKNLFKKRTSSLSETGEQTLLPRDLHENLGWVHSVQWKQLDVYWTLDVFLDQQEGATHLNRFAINQPFSSRLGLRPEARPLRDHYDIISDILGEHLQGKLLKIAVPY